MLIPFLAIKSFVDPSVEFGLSFDTQLNTQTEKEAEDGIGSLEKKPPENTKNEEPLVKKSGDVVSLESFRKS